MNKKFNSPDMFSKKKEASSFNVRAAIKKLKRKQIAQMVILLLAILFITGSMTSAKVKTLKSVKKGSIKNAYLGKNSVTSDKIKNGEVKNADIANNSVTSAKIADEQVLSSDLAANSVNSSKITDSSITANDILDGTITAAKMAAGVITGGGSSVWGSITGTLSGQTDLQSALNDKADKQEITVGDDGYGSTLAEAITAIGSDQTTLIVPSGTHEGAGVTVPVNVTLKVLRGALIHEADGTTLTINGSLEAGLYQVFSWDGSGTVVFGESTAIKTEWFGANTSAADNSAGLHAAILSLSKGGTIVFESGTYLFTSHIWADSDSPTFAPPADGIIFQGVGSDKADNFTPTNGTILKYTGSKVLFAFYQPDSAGQSGPFIWRDMTIWCSADGSAIELNSMDDAATMTGAYPKFIVRSGLQNVRLLGNTSLDGSGGRFGFAARQLYNGYIDELSIISGFGYGVWIKGSDGNRINGRFSQNNQHFRNEHIDGSAGSWGNDNIVWAMFNSCKNAKSGVPLYGIYDDAGRTAYMQTQIENDNAVTGQTPFYLNGIGTVFYTPTFSTALSTHSGEIGAEAREIWFIKPAGGGTEKWIVSDPTGYNGQTGDGGDYSIYVEQPSSQYMSTAVPNPKDGTANPRVVIVDATGADGPQAATGGIGKNEASSHSLAAFMGLEDAHTTQFLINPFTKGFTPEAESGLAWENDKEASTGWAFTIPKYVGGSYHELARDFTAGIETSDDHSLPQLDINANLRLKIRYKTSAASTGGETKLIVRNVTKGSSPLDETLPAAATSYQEYETVASIAGADEGDWIRVYVKHTLTDDDGDSTLSVDYLSIVPVAESIFSESLYLRPLSEAPSFPLDGLICTADRTNWDPLSKGSGGSYLVRYNGSAWVAIDSQ